MKKGLCIRKAESQELSRKQKRKVLRKQKKQNRNHFYQTKLNNNTSHPSPKLTHNLQTPKTNHKVSALKTFVQNNKEQVKQMKKNERPQVNKRDLQNIRNNDSEDKLIKTSSRSMHPKQTPVNKKNIKEVNSEQKYKKKLKTDKEIENEAQLKRQEKEIAYYESLLGVGKKKNKYKTIAKGMGYEDDLFDFLDNITKKVKSSNPQDSKGRLLNDSYDQEMNGENDHEDMLEDEVDSSINSDDFQMDSQNIDQMDEEDMQEQEDMENIDIKQESQPQQKNINSEEYSDNDNQYQSQEQEWDDQEDGQQYALQNQSSQIEEENSQVQGSLNEEEQAMWSQPKNQTIPHKPLLNNKKTLQTSKQSTKQASLQPQTQTKDQSLKTTQQVRRPLFANTTQQQKQQNQIRKQMNGLFNKLSDGNLMITFRQFSDIFFSSSKSNTIPVFINLFVRFNVQVEKPHLHILLSNIALASALHHLIGNRLMAPLLYQLVQKFQQFQNSPEDHEEIKQIGYSRLFEKKKNIIMILSYFYDFKSLTGDFINTLVHKLAQSLNQHNVEFLYLIIQKIGTKIRQNDPGILKEIVDTLRDSIQTFQKLQTKDQSQASKINIIEIELNQIKFNRKQPLFNDQRMAFFTTFLTKNIPTELSTQKQIVLANYNQIKMADTSHTNWWQNISNTNPINQQIPENQQEIHMLNEITAERKQLLQLAKSLHLVTQIRKNIFIEIMQASDYIEATQKVLTLKIKNLQQIAIVLLQVCILQPTFNPFYSLVASKIANINPKFKSKVQFAIWDHIKLLDSYNPRKISNLAKFAARFVANPLTNGSLSILKYFPDLINIAPEESMFLVIFFKEFLSIGKKPVLVQISKKMKEEGNRQIKEGVLQYLNEVGARQKGFDNMEKMKFLRRMILVNESQNNEEEF